MSKAVLMSIQPKWCELIASGKKTFELRKSFPRWHSLYVPFKVYIYETQGYSAVPQVYEDGTMIFKGHGQVIGEFVCDYVNNVFPTGLFVGDDRLTVDGNGDMPLEKYCMTEEQVRAYIGEKMAYGWHISDLVMYDQPKELSEFRSYNCRAVIEDGLPMPSHKIERPPQSWMYVEELR